MPQRAILVVFAVLAAVGSLAAVVLTVTTLLHSLEEDPAVSSQGGERGVIPAAPVGGAFTLTDHDGKAVTEATYRGQHLLVFFGFANCPDVCPLALDRFARVLELLGPEADKVQPLMISVDPARDTPDVLKGYVTAFDPKIVGLTGTPEQVEAAKKAYRVYSSRGEPGANGAYTVNHSTFEYLMGPGGDNLFIFTADASPERMAELIRKAIRA